MQKSTDTTKLYKGDFNLIHNPVLLEQHMDKVNNKETDEKGLVTLLNIDGNNDNDTIIFDNNLHQELTFVHEQDNIKYIVSMCEGVNRDLLKDILPKNKEEMDSEQKEMLECIDNGKDISYYLNQLAHEMNIVLVEPNVGFLQADAFSCHIYADKVQKYAEQNPEKVKEYLQPVLDAHPKVLEAIKNKEPLPKIEINKYFEGYVKYAQRLSVLQQEDLSKLSPRYLVENDKGKIQNFRLNYHGLKNNTKKKEILRN